VYFEAAQKNYFAKRFKIETTTIDKKFLFIGETKGSKLIFVSTDAHPRMEVIIDKGKNETQKETVALDEFVDVRGWKALGNKVSNLKIKEIKQISSLPEAVKTPEVENIDPSEDPSSETPAGDETGQLDLF
jgi:topoisomerase-4 subunit A